MTEEEKKAAEAKKAAEKKATIGDRLRAIFGANGADVEGEGDDINIGEAQVDALESVQTQLEEANTTAAKRLTTITNLRQTVNQVNAGIEAALEDNGLEAEEGASSEDKVAQLSAALTTANTKLSKLKGEETTVTPEAEETQTTETDELPKSVQMAQKQISDE